MMFKIKLNKLENQKGYGNSLLKNQVIILKNKLKELKKTIKKFKNGLKKVKKNGLRLNKKLLKIILSRLHLPKLK